MTKALNVGNNAFLSSIGRVNVFGRWCHTKRIGWFVYIIHGPKIGR